MAGLQRRAKLGRARRRRVRPACPDPLPVLTERTMTRVLVVHGAGMNMRGKVQVDIFGPMTLPEYDERIRGYAKELGVEVEIFHSMRRSSTRRRSARAIRRWSRRSRRSSFRRSRCISRTRSGAVPPRRPPRSARASSPVSASPATTSRYAASATSWRPRSKVAALPARARRSAARTGVCAA